jgi:hypothetical protein
MFFFPINQPTNPPPPRPFKYTCIMSDLHSRSAER